MRSEVIESFTPLSNRRDCSSRRSSCSLRPGSFKAGALNLGRRSPANKVQPCSFDFSTVTMRSRLQSSTSWPSTRRSAFLIASTSSAQTSGANPTKWPSRPTIKARYSVTAALPRKLMRPCYLVRLRSHASLISKTTIVTMVVTTIGPAKTAASVSIFQRGG